MNIYTKKIFDQFTDCYFYYEISPEKHSESVYLYFEYVNDDDDRPDTEKKYTLIENAPILSEWFRSFGYENNEESVSHAFGEIRKLSEILAVKKNLSKKAILNNMASMTDADVLDMGEQAFKVLKPVIETLPLLSNFYHETFSIISHWRFLLSDTGMSGAFKTGFARLYQHLDDELTHLEAIYTETRKFCKAVFQVDNLPDSDVSPQTISYMYREYCSDAKERYYIDKPVLKSTPAPESYSDLTGEKLNIPWELYYHARKQSSVFDDNGISAPLMQTMEDVAYAGINYLLESESVLRVCKLCGKTFRIKYTSSQEYCTRLYGDTKAACNEYASRRSYKEKLFQHPIHQEFTRAYNKLYGRIRRGKLPADTPLMDQLKRLHEDYYERYENTHLKEREKVWKEYIEKNKELLV